MRELVYSEGDVVVGSGRLHFYRTGGARPPLVLVHGWTNSARCWDEAAAALRADFDVIAYDARGHGWSGRLSGRQGEAERADDLLGLITALGLVRPGLLGHSMGAATVASAAARRPEMPAFVILEDPPWYASPDEREARNAGWGDWFAWVRAVPGKDPAQALEEYQAQNPAWSDQTLRLRLEAFRQLDPRVLTDLDWDPRPWREMAAAIRCPWLLVIGEPELGGIVTAARAQEAVAQSAAGRWVQIAGAGHNVRYDQPERYLRVLRDFLAAVTPSARQRQRSQPE